MIAGQGRKAIALLTAKEIFDLVRDDLVLVEEELARQSAGAFEPVSEITSYLLGGGGKRLRPALLLLCNAYTGRRSAGAIRLAAVVELAAFGLRVPGALPEPQEAPGVDAVRGRHARGGADLFPHAE